MIDYVLLKVEDSVDSTIRVLVQNICKENKVNYAKQEYHILFSNEKMLLSNNDTKFTSGSKKDLSFYGKVYLNKNGRVIESIFLQDNSVELEPKENELLIMRGGLDNSTVVENDHELLYFYIAPNSLLGRQKPKLWQPL